MSEVAKYIAALEDAGVVEKGRIQKLAASAFRLEIGDKALHPIEALKEMVGIRKPLHKRMLEYVSEGIEQAKPKAGLAAIGLGAALATALGVKAYNEFKFNNALKILKKDPEFMTDPARGESLAKVVRRYAPSLAADHEILKGTVKNLMKFPDSYVGHDLAKKLSEAEKEYAATHGLLSILKSRVI